ncbi:hypothetical protein D3C81_1257220 [compost metagenome]
MDPLGMGLRVGQRQGRAPGAAEQHPLVDAQVLADALHVRHQIPGGVAVQAGMRGRAAAAALVEGDDAVDGRIEPAAAGLVTAGPRPAVHEQHRQAVRDTAFVDIQLVRMVHRQLVAGVGFDLWIQAVHAGPPRLTQDHPS